MWRKLTCSFSLKQTLKHTWSVIHSKSVCKSHIIYFRLPGRGLILLNTASSVTRSSLGALGRSSPYSRKFLTAQSVQLVFCNFRPRSSVFGQTFYLWRNTLCPPSCLEHCGWHLTINDSPLHNSVQLWRIFTMQQVNLFTSPADNSRSANAVTRTKLYQMILRVACAGRPL